MILRSCGAWLFYCQRGWGNRTGCYPKHALSPLQSHIIERIKTHSPIFMDARCRPQNWEITSFQLVGMLGSLVAWLLLPGEAGSPHILSGDFHSRRSNFTEVTLREGCFTSISVLSLRRWTNTTLRKMTITHKITKKREDLPITEVAALRDANMSQVTSEDD